LLPATARASKRRRNGKPAGPGALGTPSPAAGAPPAAAAPDPPEWPALQALLARPVNYPDYVLHRPRMREVPRLSPESEARLIALWGRTNSLWAKQHLVRILVFGGGAASGALLRRALTEEFAGQEVSAGTASQLEYLPELMGILARHDDATRAFLLQGSRPGFWERQPLWRPVADWRETHPGMLVASCLRGLALSGGPEFEEVLDWYRQHPEALFVPDRRGELRGIGGAIIDALFFRSLERRMGIEALMDEVIYDPEMGARNYFVPWRESPEGRAVRESWDKLEAEGWARWAAARRTAPPPEARPGP
jgi:hypothetical protein